MKNILDEIVRLRTERNWSEYTLAKNCGLSQSTIGGWYRSHQTPTIQTLDKICRGLGITLSQFFAEGFSDQRRTGYAGRMVRPSSSKVPAGGRAAEKSLAALCLDLKTKL